MAARSAKSPAPNFSNKTLLLISPVEQDHEILKSLFAGQACILLSAHSLGSAVRFLQDHAISVIVTERELPGGTWRDVLETVRPLPSSPPVIVTSLHADEQLWAEALNLGAYDVLAKPLNKAEILRVLHSAWIKTEEVPRSSMRATGSAA